MDLDDILDYIKQNLKRDLTLAELSERYHYSPRQLYYYLHGITGMPIKTYIRKRKLVNAAREISLGRKMYDVALDYGFETQAGFYKAFLQCIGCTPSQFRNHTQLQQLKKIDPKLLSLRKEQKNMEEIKIRKMEMNDVNSLWENIFSGNTPEEVKSRVQKNIAEMDAGNCAALVAVIDRQVIGMVLVAKSQHALTSHRCEFMDLVVNPAFQKQGLGKRLCQEGFASARKLGCDHVISTCRGKGVEPFFNSAEPFYRAIGMELCGRIPNGFQEPWGDRNKPLMAAYGTCAGSAHSFQ